MWKRVVAAASALVASLVMLAVAEAQAEAACSKPAYGNVWCWPSHGPVPPPHQPPPVRR